MDDVGPFCDDSTVAEGSTDFEDQDVSRLCHQARTINQWQFAIVNSMAIALDDLEVLFLVPVQVPVDVIRTEVEPVDNTGSHERLEDDLGAINAAAEYCSPVMIGSALPAPRAFEDSDPLFELGHTAVSATGTNGKPMNFSVGVA